MGEMDEREAIRSQYQAALEMLKQTIARCPESMWDDAGDRMPFWRIAYHVLFYTHLYLSPTEADFMPWARHRQDYQALGPLPWPPHREPEIGEPFTREDVLAYLEVCRKEVDERMGQVNLDGDSGFDWLPFGKRELQIYNIRHLQQHTGELMERLGTRANIELEWVGMKHP